MIPVFLIAANFLREQRWLTLVLVLYALGGAAAFDVLEVHISGEDVLFFLRQQALYSVLFSFFLAVSALHNERKSRRMLAVLSKAITRREYLAGLLAGIISVFGIYCLAIGISGMWLVRNATATSVQLWTLLGLIAVASLLVSAVALFFSTFLSPVFATAATAAALAMGAALGQALGRGWAYALPAYSLAMQVAGSSGSHHTSTDWLLVAIALAETLLLWAFASWIFSGRDITTAVE